MSGFEECMGECDMCRYIVECVGMFFIVSVTGSLWNVSVYCGMCRCVFHMEVVGSLWNVSVCCGMCRYVFHRECDGWLVTCVGILWNVSVCFSQGGCRYIVECVGMFYIVSGSYSP